MSQRFRHGAGNRDAALGNRELNKYRSQSVIVRRIVDPFVRAVVNEARLGNPLSVLDVGCGEGHVTRALARALPAASVAGFDLDEPPNPTKGIEWGRGDITRLPFSAASWDVVLATEVLEHLLDPAAAVRELRRVAARRVVVTVPHEPYWRMANLARLTYVRDFGNTPGHIQHWGMRSLRAMLEPHMRDLKVRPVSLWLLASGRVD